MTSSPFLTPEGSRLRRAEAARRRRRNRIAGAGLCTLAALAAAILLLWPGGGADRRGARAAGTRSSSVRVPAAPKVSQTGLALGRPPLLLKGLAEPARDPIKLQFRHPPRAGLLFNLDTGQVLWQRNPERQLEIASLTKMMTALLTVRSTTPDGHVLVSRAAVESNGSKVGVLPLGKHVRVETMLYGLMLPSGNDAAVALAEYVSGSVGAFVARMNAEAARLGMACTRYSSPSGYFDRANHSCAADLAVLAGADLAQPRIARVVHTYSAELPFPIKGGKLYLYNNNPLLIYRYPGTTGLKTGYTEAAGRCLVATAERGGVRLGVVILNSNAPGVQSKQLLDRGFQDVYHLPRVPEPPIPAGA
jgi:serine-type D-Ala-D-Ala carboxypeptidase (penicillin-binding protein 5/6)